MHGLINETLGSQADRKSFYFHSFLVFVIQNRNSSFANKSSIINIEREEIIIFPEVN